MKYYSFLIAGLLLLFLTSPAVAERTELTIGAILPLSGDPAAVGENCRRGIELAVKKQRAAGIPIKVVYEDTPNALARNTLSAYKKLRAIHDVEVFLGFMWSEELGAVGPLADKEGVALLGFGASQVRPKNAILIWPSEYHEARVLARRIIDDGRRKVAILSENSTWPVNFSRAFVEEFSRLGGTVTEVVELAADTSDVAPSLVKLKEQKLEALVIPPYTLFPQYVKSLHKLGATLPLYGAELDQSAIDRAGEGAEGATIIVPADPQPEFIAEFKREFEGDSPDIPAANCYDGVSLVVKAFQEETLISGKEIAEYLTSLSEYRGVLGSYRFEKGETITELAFKTVKKGRL